MFSKPQNVYSLFENQRKFRKTNCQNESEFSACAQWIFFWVAHCCCCYCCLLCIGLTQCDKLTLSDTKWNIFVCRITHRYSFILHLIYFPLRDHVNIAICIKWQYLPWERDNAARFGKKAHTFYFIFFFTQIILSHSIFELLGSGMNNTNNNNTE